MKFREKGTSETTTTNLAGGAAYEQTPKIELVSLLLTSFVEDQFYRSKETQLDKLKQLIKDIPDKGFIAKAIIYARNEFGLRSITHAAIVELIPHLKGYKAGSSIVRDVIRRPDDILEIVAYWKKHHKGGLPNILRKGINAAIATFDEYRLAKYRGENSSVKMVDVFNLTHPKPTTPEREELYKRLMTGQLKNTDTWESKLSKAGQEGETEEEVMQNKEGAWKELLETKKLGYFALLRNLRNIIIQAPFCIDMVCEALVDEKEIKKSLVFPFRFMTAIEALKNSINEKPSSIQSKFSYLPKVIRAIDTALEISLNNVPSFDGSTLIVLDKSGSMAGKPIEIGALFAAVLLKRNPNAHLMLFAEDARYKLFDSRTPLTTLADLIMKDTTGGGTNFRAIFHTASQKYDRVFILSDMQGWMDFDGIPQSHFNVYALSKKTAQSSLDKYKSKYDASPFVYSFDLQGYGSMQFKPNNVFAIAGFSEKIFDVVKLMEQDKAALFNAICNYEKPLV